MTLRLLVEIAGLGYANLLTHDWDKESIAKSGWTDLGDRSGHAVCVRAAGTLPTRSGCESNEHVSFKYSVRLPGAADVVNLDWLASKFLATLDALTKIDSNI